MSRWLDRIPTLKLRLGLVIVVGVGASGIAALVARSIGVPLIPSFFVGMVVALALVQVIARGLTWPLREMANASHRMARGEHGVSVAGGDRVDEVGELARAFNSMSAELAETDRQRRDIVANVAHELRTPIGALQAKLENVLDGIEQPDDDAFDTMLQQVRRLGRLVEQLLDLSRLESRETPFTVVPFAVSPMLENVAKEVRLHAPRGVELAVDAPADARVNGSAERVHQVVLNLVENAVRHSPRPGRVGLNASSPNGNGRVRIEVVDEGPGIPPEEVDRVFERFYRTDRARTADAGGTGLGLAIAKWIVELHGGVIRAEAAEPSGCRMVVELPAAT